MKFHAASHCPTFNVVVALNDWLLHAVDAHVGVVPFVVYLIVPSVAVQVTANDGPNV